MSSLVVGGILELSIEIECGRVRRAGPAVESLLSFDDGSDLAGQH